MKERPQSQILILTNPADTHAFVVREALRLKGAEPVLWHTTDFPTRQTASAWYGCMDEAFELIGPEIDLKRPPVATAWLRRPEPPVLPESVDPADREFSLRECMLFLRSLYRELGPAVFWVNPLESQARSILKPEQLRVASRSGFSIPKTLCSNDAYHIREFIRTNPGGVIYKTLFPVSWNTTDGVAVLFSSVISEDDLPTEPTLRLTPGIFQELVPKSFELRITVIGNRLFAVKLRSQEIEEAKIDYRLAITEVPLEPFTVTPALVKACLKMMAELGLVFGCFDFIVTPSGDFVFLEVNEMGAFLWLEEQLPELGILDAFSEFLLQASPAFRLDNARTRVRLQDVTAEATYQREVVARQLHVTQSGSTLIEDSSEPIECP